MKIIILSFFALLWSKNSCASDTDTFITNRFRKIIGLIEAGKAKELAKFVNYPLKRQNPLPDIKNEHDFISQYHTLFDSAFKTLLKKYDDNVIFEHHGAYGLVGGSFAGEIWIDFHGKISAINYSSVEEQHAKQLLIKEIKEKMHPTVNTWNENVLVAESKTLLIRIDETDNGLRYVCWSHGKTIKDPPDIVLYDGISEAHGTGGGWSWKFRNDDWAYVIDDVEECGDTEDCGLFLKLLFKDELKSTTALSDIK